VQRQVCLLRGINLGSRNRVNMAELRAFFEEFGHREVATYVNSGNVVFTPAGEVDEQQLRDTFARRFGFDAAMVVRSTGDLGAIIRRNPFPEADPGRELHVGFMAEVAGANVVEDLELEAFGPERALVLGREFFMYLPAGMGRSRLPAYLDRRLGRQATVRNWNTVLALARLSSG
jgi:uncharacterized protein (DUF1697 family)